VESRTNHLLTKTALNYSREGQSLQKLTALSESLKYFGDTYAAVGGITQSLGMASARI
jgi:hypothetical protein